MKWLKKTNKIKQKASLIPSWFQNAVKNGASELELISLIKSHSRGMTILYSDGSSEQPMNDKCAEAVLASFRAIER